MSRYGCLFFSLAFNCLRVGARRVHPYHSDQVRLRSRRRTVRRSLRSGGSDSPPDGPAGHRPFGRVHRPCVTVFLLLGTGVFQLNSRVRVRVGGGSNTLLQASLADRVLLICFPKVKPPWHGEYVKKIDLTRFLLPQATPRRCAIHSMRSFAL